MAEAALATHGQSDPATWHTWQRRLHWTTVGLVTLTVLIALYLVVPEEIPQSKTGTFIWNLEFYLSNIHHLLGIMILAVMLVRMALRVKLGAPRLYPVIPAAQERFANFIHVLLYINIIFMAVVGLGMLYAASYPITLRLWEWHIVPAEREFDLTMFRLMQDLHLWGAYALGGLVGLHIAAALKHHFIDKNGVVTRMLRGTHLRDQEAHDLTH